jgi:hypothetical protein
MRKARRLVLTVASIFLPFVLLASCQDRRTVGFVHVVLANGSTTAAELAVSPEEKARGLMFRENLPAGHGMLFVFDREGFHPFWMKNTLLTLDIIWLDSRKRVVHIEAGVPPCRVDPCRLYRPANPGLYVLEIVGGAAAGSGIRLGDQLHFVLPDGLR